MATVRSSKASTPTTKSPQSPTSPQSTAGNAKQLVSGDGQEDIESIAKQISDHAEAIYQTWKARGLAPTEILNCHTTNDTFGKNLQSPIHPGNMKLKYTKDNNNSPVTELLVNAPDMSNNSLEKLVNTFVNEDKARLAARKRNSPTSGSTIQHALKKFEKTDSPIILNKSSPLSPSSSPSPSSSMKKSNVPDVLMNTLDQVLPNNNNNNSNNKESLSHNSNNATNKISSSSPSSQKPQTPVKPANLINHVPSWPLKNRLGNSPTGSGSTQSSSSSRSSKESSPTKDIVDSPTKPSSSSSSAIVTQQQQKIQQSTKNSSDLLDEVSREEERLINALKTGHVINSSDNKMLPEVITSTLQPDNKLNWKKPDVSTTNQSPNTVTATWNGIQLKPVAAAAAASNTAPHPSKIDEVGNSTYVKLKQPRAPRTENVPHPELSATRNLNVRSTSSSPVRPFLTRGSVAERVLIFERCPEIKTPLRTSAKEPIKIQKFIDHHRLRSKIVSTIDEEGLTADGSAIRVVTFSNQVDKKDLIEKYDKEFRLDRLRPNHFFVTLAFPWLEPHKDIMKEAKIGWNNHNHLLLKVLPQILNHLSSTHYSNELNIFDLISLKISICNLSAAANHLRNEIDYFITRILRQMSEDGTYLKDKHFNLKQYEYDRNCRPKDLIIKCFLYEFQNDVKSVLTDYDKYLNSFRLNIRSTIKLVDQSDVFQLLDSKPNREFIIDGKNFDRMTLRLFTDLWAYKNVIQIILDTNYHWISEGPTTKFEDFRPIDIKLIGDNVYDFTEGFLSSLKTLSYRKDLVNLTTNQRLSCFTVFDNFVCKYLRIFDIFITTKILYDLTQCNLPHINKLQFISCTWENKVENWELLNNIKHRMAKPYIKPLPAHTTLQRHIKNSAKNVYIPRFHFPNGKPLPTITIETTLQRIQAEFNSFPNYQISRDNFHRVVTACGVPLYWRSPLYYCTQLTADGCVDGNRFIDFWKQMTINCNDAASRFVTILKGRHTRNHLLPEDFVSLVQDVVDTHPGLQFLKEAAEFHSRYIHTVIARIYYHVNRSWTNRITVQEIRRSNLLQIIQLLEEEEDINQITQYFSYEHFYVIYCKFWELDRDHDLLIDQNDLARHNDHALSTRMIERIFTGGVIKRMRLMAAQTPPNKMTYSEFVYFLLAEEDKAHQTAIEYWFRCMDIDGDGILSMYELQYFYEEQQQRMESLGIEILPFADCICQMLDMIKPVRPGCITLGDLKRCKMTPIFYDTFFNFEKYIENEHRDPFASQRDGDDMSDWDRYAAMEYELLVSEESGDTQGSCEEEDYEDFLSDFYFKPRSYDEDSDYQEHPTLDLTNLFDHYLENE